MLRYASLLLCLIMSWQLSANQKPNVIYILADDLGYGDLSCFGQKAFKTPGLDRMAAEGMKLTQHYSSSTVCAPARASLLSGFHSGRSPLRANGKHSIPVDPSAPLISTRFKKLGYATAMIGKSGVSCDGADKKLPNKHGFDHFFGYLGHKEAHYHFPKYLWRNGQKVMLKTNNGRKGDEYAEELIAKDVFRWVKENKNKPFFLHWAFAVPHAGMNCPDDVVAPFLGKFGKEKPYKGGHYVACKAPKAYYAAMISHMDKQIGMLLDQLKEYGIAENTLVIFSADNGPTKVGGIKPSDFKSSGIYRGLKRDLYEGGIRVPTIAWWPGQIKAGTESNHPSSGWDFPVTAMDAVGADTDFETDGISFLPTLTGKGKQKQHKYLYWEFHEQGGKQAVLFGNGRWKAVRLNVYKNNDGPIQLFDLQNDPSEKNNIANKKPELVSEASKMMKEAHSKTDKFSFEKSSKKKKKK